MKIMIVGDTHGAANHWNLLLNHYGPKFSPDAIMQVGDFGYWPHRPGGEEYLDAIEAMLAVLSEDTGKEGIKLYWIDGNHENFDALEEVPVNDDGFRYVRDHILHVPRGHVWEWDGVRCMGIGGAYSIDKSSRREGSSWWPQEMITDADIAKANAAGKVDVVFSHDCPAHVEPLRLSYILQYGRGLRNIGRSDENRLNLSLALREAQPQFLFHGHWHLGYHGTWQAPWGDVKVVGLPHEAELNFMIVDTDELRSGRLDLTPMYTE